MPSEPIADVSTAALQERGRRARTPRVIPALTLVSHPVPRRVGERLLLQPVAEGRAMEVSRNAPDFTRPRHALGLPLSDPFVSRKPLGFEPVGEGGVRVVVSEGGTRVVLSGEVLQGSRDFDAGALAEGVPLELAGRVVVLLHTVDLDLEGGSDALEMVGESTGVRRVRRHIERVADLDVPVLIRGETGTGKELVARAIHQRSRRREEKFVSVNLGAIPKELAAAELFGTQKGAYTGATSSRDGFFGAARGGTLFLDEVGEAPPEVQVMLLRVLETGEMYPVGGTTPVSTDVRLIAATDAHLEEQIREGRFKAPLLHRLAGYDIRVPALRERREDLGRLFFHFAAEALATLGEAHRLENEDPHAEPWLPTTLAARLVHFAWPGNIRQLRNLTRQLVIGSRGQSRLHIEPVLEAELGPGVSTPRVAPVTPRPASVARRKPSQVTQEELLTALRANDWDVKAAADALGIPRPSLYDLIDKSPHVRTAGDLSAEEITRCFHESGGDLEVMVRRLEVSRRALGRRLKELGLGAKGT
ncbi:sigma-54 dependent transcriptional regulator [Corallococcus sp. M34]|uniref:sigma 54-interacting transcriptional regulator n=1 Tax=Citreicoccus inhibens TaxID=2849499 RepID=UPI001C22D146|nr:sigma-54 dependent transcriptional regulator [Citreicoccus inhibens]MBU8898782.1 sigma-54 dependent transcriptional regulator [Citreicoccus inhibens]